MNISYNWLRDLVETRMTPPELAECLTFVGLTVEAVHPAGDDFVLELDVTSNRGDCLSHLGVAREVAAAEHTRLRRLPEPPESVVNRVLSIIYPKSEIDCCAGRTSDLAAVEIWDADLCPRYAARIIRGVKIAPSPAWLVKRLEAIGQRPINNITDITNYVLHELGQPLHAFDLATLKGSRIIVRRANEGEKMKTLDGVERTFDRDMLLICDAERPVAVAGVMGGLDTEITEATTDVLLESAYFTPATVRRTSKLLGLSTEAAKRFERGVDPEGVRRAQDRAAALMWEIAGGTVTEDALDVYPAPFVPVTLSVRPQRVKLLTGLDVAAEEITRILVALGFTAEGEASENALRFTAPTWRHDMEREADLIEEVARHVGYDQIPEIVPPSAQAGSYLAHENRRRAVRQALGANGYDEAINFSFISDAQDETFEFLPDLVADSGDAAARFVTLSNSIIEDKPRMRATLLPGLLEAVRHNFNHGTRDVRLFELGRLFATRAGQPLPEEREAFALVATGRASSAGNAVNSAETDFYDIKGTLETVAAAIHLPPLRYEAAAVKHLREGQAARLFLAEGRCVGTVGRLSESISAIYKFRQAVYLAELDLATIFATEAANIRYSPLPRYPAIIRDLSLMVSRRVTWADLQAEIAGLGLAYCRNLSLIEVYEGVHIPEDQRSVTLRLEYRAADRTLRDEEAEAAHGQVIAALTTRYGAQQRA